MSTINHRIQPLVSQLNAILGSLICVIFLETWVSWYIGGMKPADSWAKLPHGGDGMAVLILNPSGPPLKVIQKFHTEISHGTLKFIYIYEANKIYKINI